jgi:hypothetical protein
MIKSPWTAFNLPAHFNIESADINRQSRYENYSHRIEVWEMNIQIIYGHHGQYNALLVPASAATAASPTTPGVDVATLGGPAVVRASAFPLSLGISPSRWKTAPSGCHSRISAGQRGRAAAHPGIAFQAEIQPGLFGVLMLDH